MTIVSVRMPASPHMWLLRFSNHLLIPEFILLTIVLPTARAGQRSSFHSVRNWRTCLGKTWDKTMCFCLKNPCSPSTLLPTGQRGSTNRGKAYCLFTPLSLFVPLWNRGRGKSSKDPPWGGQRWLISKKSPDSLFCRGIAQAFLQSTCWEDVSLIVHRA